MDYNSQLKFDSDKMEKSLENIMSEQMLACPSKRVIKAESYSLLAGGKHIRSVLCLEFYKLFGGCEDIDKIAACLELVHTFSLIHDDMPEMDDDILRRGKPTCHVKFDTATALLAGDGLAILPYEIISSMSLEGTLPAQTALKLINLLATSSGNSGMISGQMIDLLGEKQQLNCDEIKQMYKYKTGAMIKCSCLFGALLASADDEAINDVNIYAENIGLAFQLVDDLLNITSTEEVLGKPVGSDDDRHKNTLTSHIGIEKTRSIIQSATDAAVAAINKYEGSEFLVRLAYELATRNN